MYKIHTEIGKNRLYITINGILSLEEAKKARAAIESSVASLKTGFDVINDISKLIRADEAGGIVLKEINVLLIQKGVKRIVRVVGTSKIGLIQFANNTVQIEQYKIHYVPSMKEAEKLLDGDGEE